MACFVSATNVTLPFLARHFNRGQLFRLKDATATKFYKVSILIHFSNLCLSYFRQRLTRIVYLSMVLPTSLVCLGLFGADFSTF